MGSFNIYLIVNCSKVEMKNIEKPYDGAFIPTLDRPSFLHTDLDKAKDELLRMQANFPTEEFILFQSRFEAIKINGSKHYKINEFRPEE
jgi:hypothetical protein